MRNLGTSQYSHRSRGQERNDAQRYYRLQHCQQFGPGGKNRRIGWRERSTCIKGHEQIIDKARRPACHSLLGKLCLTKRHLRKKKCSASMPVENPADVRAAGIQSPIPQGENQHVGNPEYRSLPQQSPRSFNSIQHCMSRKDEGRNHKHRDHRNDDNRDNMVDVMQPAPTSDNHWDKHDKYER